LIKFLKLRYVPKKHWSNEASREIVEYVDHEVRKMISVVIQNAKFVCFTCAEVTSMDNGSWANMYGYVLLD